MAVCGNCGATSSRIRSRWSKEGVKFPDECPSCAPEAFDGKFTAPSDKKIWMGYEAHPNEYVKAEDGGYDRKLEYRAEQEARIAAPTAEEIEIQRRAEAKKRAERRTEPMTHAEMVAAMAKASIIADWVAKSAEKGIDA
jgi:hypothetical protein